MRICQQLNSAGESVLVDCLFSKFLQMDSNSDNTTSSSVEFPKVSSSDSLEEAITTTNNNRPRDDSLFLDEDHFSIHSENDLFEDSDFRLSNLNRVEQLESSINKCTAQLRTLSENQEDLNFVELETQKKKLVKRICDLKVKLAKLKEDEELESALKDQTTTTESASSAGDNPILFQRNYSFVKFVCGHKLVPSADVFENEKRLNCIWKTYLRNSHSCASPLSTSPTSSSNFLLQSLPTARILNLLKTNHLANISYSEWANLATPATNPLDQLVCDQCLKKSTKSFNDYLPEAFKFGKKAELSSSVPASDSPRPTNHYLVCIYCFFTIHSNCLSRVIRKCPKLFFDDLSDELLEDHYGKLYNPIEGPDEERDGKICQINPVNASHKSLIERHKKRMKRIILRICPEIGLAKQDFRCWECRTLLASSTVVKNSELKLSKSRLCDYSGLYFCENCHIGDTAVIPARVLHNWDFQPQPVSRAALQIISYLKNTLFHFDRPVLINLVEVNGMLYGLVDELIQVKRLRSELCHIFKYISLCKQPSKPRQWISILCQLGAHLLNDAEANFLSFTDICDLRSLVTNLSDLENLFIEHITNCESCKGKGFFCELCPNKDDILFPFSPNTTICVKCNAVYHKNCYFRRNRICPRCNRINDKNKQRSMEIAEDDL